MNLLRLTETALKHFNMYREEQDTEVFSQTKDADTACGGEKRSESQPNSSDAVLGGFLTHGFRAIPSAGVVVADLAFTTRIAQGTPRSGQIHKAALYYVAEDIQDKSPCVNTVNCNKIEQSKLYILPLPLLKSLVEIWKYAC